GTLVGVALDDCVMSAWATAATVTVAGFGTAPGAVYSPVASILPIALLPGVIPFTVQLTALLLLPVTEAVNCCFWLGTRFAVGGDTLTVTPPPPPPPPPPPLLLPPPPHDGSIVTDPIRKANIR